MNIMQLLSDKKSMEKLVDTINHVGARMELIPGIVESQKKIMEKLETIEVKVNQLQLESHPYSHIL